MDYCHALTPDTAGSDGSPVAGVGFLRAASGDFSKQFTAAAVLLLEERGMLQTTDLVKRHLPDAPAAWDGITIHHLLTHTSGIPNVTALPEFQSIRTLPTRPDRLVASFRNKPLDFAPGERFNYSNSGYALLAALVERLGGLPFERFVQENIFDRLEMKQTGSDTLTAIIPRRAAGYSPASGARSGELRNAQYIDMTVPIGGGSLYSTTDDLTRWAHALFGGKLLSAESLQKMTRPEKDNYAYGLRIGNVGERRAYNHPGGIEGFNSAL
jgi:CubicO group peptidase (beta-lactamase class C family)